MSKQKGNITEVECMLSFLKLGYNVLTPYGDCERYDFVVEINNKFYKIQVKTANASHI
jgi:ribosome biogenesis protein Tsr3